MDHCNHACMVEQSCCGLSLRTGSLLSGIFLLLTAILEIAAIFVVKDLSNPHKYFLGVIAALSLIGAISLLYGSFKCSRTCIKIGRAILFLLTAISLILLILAILSTILLLMVDWPFLIQLKRWLNFENPDAKGKPAPAKGKGDKPNITSSLLSALAYLIFFLLYMYMFAVVNSFYHSLCQNCG